MTLTRWTPLTGLAAVEIDRLNRMFDAAFSGDASAERAWVPPVDIVETAGQDIVVRVDLPEVKRDDIKLHLENGKLTIEGERKRAEEELTYHRVERGHGAFRRSFSMPQSADAARVTAEFKDGVLIVTIPRREDTKPRQIVVNG